MLINLAAKALAFSESVSATLNKPAATLNRPAATRSLEHPAVQTLALEPQDQNCIEP